MTWSQKVVVGYTCLVALKKCVPVYDIVSVYTCYVGPICEYATSVWHGNILNDFWIFWIKINKNKASQLEGIQKCACCIILGPSYNSYVDACHVLGLQSLEEIRLHLCSQFAHKSTKSNRYANWFPPVLVPTIWLSEILLSEIVTRFLITKLTNVAIVQYLSCQSF